MSTLDLFRIDGKTALVTGASRGLGKEMAIGLGEAGANIVVTARTASEVEAAAEEIADVSGAEVLPVIADVTSPEDTARMITDTEERFGAVDILVNNAGMNVRHLLTEYPLDDWKKVTETNITGVFLATKAALPGMIERGWGRVINIGSIMGTIGLPTRVPYAATKGAVHQMTKTLSLEVAEHGITVNTIAPGPFMTEMNKPVMDDKETYEFFISNIPLGRWGNPEELRGTAVYLASEASSFVTGATIYVDGGWTAH